MVTQLKNLSIIQPGDSLLGQEIWETPIPPGFIYDGDQTARTRDDGVLLAPVIFSGKHFYQEWDLRHQKSRRPVRGWSNLASRDKINGTADLPDGSKIVCMHEWVALLIGEASKGIYTGRWEPVHIELRKPEHRSLRRQSKSLVVESDCELAIPEMFYCSYRFTPCQDRSPRQPYKFRRYLWDIRPGPALLEHARINIVPEPEILDFGYKLYLAASELKKTLEATVPAEN